MKENTNEFRFWRKAALFNIDFAAYRLNSHEFSKHYHEHFVIEWVAAGADRFFCAGKTYTAETGQLVFINPGEVHTGSTVAEMDLRYFSLCPDLPAIQEMAECLQIPISPAFEFGKTVLDNPALANQMSRLSHSLFSDLSDECEQEEIFIQLMHCLLSRITATHTQPKLENDRLEMLKEYIRTCCCEPLRLSHFSSLVHLNPFHLIRIFKQFTGMSPYDYLMNARIEKAKSLLRNGMPSQTVAIQTGFYDDAHFSRQFKKRAGVRPGIYQGGDGIAVDWQGKSDNRKPAESTASNC